MNPMREAIRRCALAPARIVTEEAEQSFRFGEDFPGFSGHFPGYPLLPAVLQALLAQLLAEQLAGQPLRLQILERAKFLRQLRPGEEVRVTIRCREEKDRLHCATQLQVAGELAASFNLVLGKEPLA